MVLLLIAISVGVLAVATATGILAHEISDGQGWDVRDRRFGVTVAVLFFPAALPLVLLAWCVQTVQNRRVVREAVRVVERAGER